MFDVHYLVFLLFSLAHISTGFNSVSRTCKYRPCIPLQALNSLSDADIDELVLERVIARKNRDYGRADSIKQELGVHDIQIIDKPYQSGGTSTWRRLNRSHRNKSSESIMDLAKRMAHSPADFVPDASLLDVMRQRLREDAAITLPSDRELTGRAYADIALYLALAGVGVDTNLFDILVQGGLGELHRTGARNRNRIVDILTQCEKMAAAGVTDQEYFLVASEIICEKIVEGKRVNAYSNTEIDRYETAIRRLRGGSFTLFNERSQTIIFHRAARLKKVNIKDVSPTTLMLADLYVDPTLPLIVDLGCGFGLSLLGMASQTEQQAKEYNFLGIDLSVRALRYASGLSQRWQLDGQCKFVLMDALTAVHKIQEEYSGEVALVCISYPSPFPLCQEINEDGDSISSGNMQLPQKSAFLLQANVVQTIASILRENGGLYLQSNAEDVLLYMKKMVETANTSLIIPEEGVDVIKGLPPHVTDASKMDSIGWVETAPMPPPRQGSRLAKYLASGRKRATGKGFLNDSPFKDFAKTETEAAYTLDGRVDELHRVVFFKKEQIE